MRGQVDLLVVLSHVGFPQDVQFAKDVPGIDVIVSGHTHNRMEQAIEVEGCLIFQSGCHGSFIGRLDLDLQDGALVGWKHALIAVDESVPPDPEFEAAVTDDLTGEREAMAAVVGRTDVALHRYAMLSKLRDDVLHTAIDDGAGTE